MLNGLALSSLILWVPLHASSTEPEAAVDFIIEMHAVPNCHCNSSSDVDDWDGVRPMAPACYANNVNWKVTVSPVIGTEDDGDCAEPPGCGDVELCDGRDYNIIFTQPAVSEGCCIDYLIALDGNEGDVGERIITVPGSLLWCGEEGEPSTEDRVVEFRCDDNPGGVMARVTITYTCGLCNQ